MRVRTAFSAVVVALLSTFMAFDPGPAPPADAPAAVDLVAEPAVLDDLIAPSFKLYTFVLSRRTEAEKQLCALGLGSSCNQSQCNECTNNAYSECAYSGCGEFTQPPGWFWCMWFCGPSQIIRNCTPIE